MRIGLCIALLFFVNSVIFAQIDSLQSVLSKKNHDTVAINLYNEIGNYYQSSNIDSAIHYHHRAINLAKKIKNDYLTIIGYRELCWAYFQKGEFEVGKKTTLLTIDLIQKTKDKKIIKKKDELLGALYGNQGNFYTNQGRFNEALKYYFKSYKYYQNVNSDVDQATMLGNIGLVYFNLHDNEKALKYQLQALKLSESTNDQDGIATRLANIGGIYADQKDNKQALVYYQKSLDIFVRDSNEYAMAILLTNIGYVYILLEDYSLAIQYLKKAEDYSNKVGDRSNLALVHINFGDAYIGLKNYDRALQYLSSGENMAIDLEALDLLHIVYRDYFELYELKNDYKNAIYYYKKHIIFRDSVEDRENAERLIQQEIQFEYDKRAFSDSINYSNQKKIKDAEITKQKALAKQKDAEVQAKRKQQYYLFAGLGMVLIFSILLLNRYRFVQRQKKIIEEKEKETTQQIEIIEEKQKEIIDSINYAQRLQKAILAPEELIKKYFPNSFLLYLPKDIVAGDFYFFEITENHIFYAAADCTGHGVPGAMVSIVCSNALTRCVKEFGLTDPGKILDKTRELVVETFEKSGSDVKDGMDISLCVFKVQSSNFKEAGSNFKHSILNFEQISWAGANNPLWYIENGEIKEIKADKQPIGKTENSKPFTTHILSQSLSEIFLFTDGYADQFGGPKGKKFKYSNLQKLLLENSNLEPSSLNIKLRESFANWKGELEQVDDVCLIGIRI